MKTVFDIIIFQVIIAVYDLCKDFSWNSISEGSHCL